jgi:UDP-2,3-diacylglucosamine pyrophosphatase LpxH
MNWITWLSDKATSANKELQVMHLCDIHAPFHDPYAIDLAFQMVEKAQPDVVVVGSDFADLYLTTHFDIDPDLAQYDDELNCLEEHWNPFINRLKKAAPNAVNLFIWGNHEQRLIRKLWKDAKQFRKRLLGNFRDIVKNNGSVWYLGENVNHVRIGPLQVEHGSRYNEHVVKSRLYDEGAQISLMMGHVHKRNFYEIQGADFAVNGISSGCLCPTDPHYAFGTAQSGRKWVQGTAVASFALDEREVLFENNKFADVGTKKVTRFRGERLETSMFRKTE